MTNKPNWKNRTLFHGDNLKYMRAMDSETVDLIATDPPFNKGRDFHATPDSLASGAKFQDVWSWERDVHEEWIDQITDDYPNLIKTIENARQTHSDSMGAFLCFMAVRLLEMHRLLKPTGSIYLHCDPTASHYLKMIMDAIFESKNFLGEIQWNKQNGVKTRTKWGNENEMIFCYAKKNGSHVFNISDDEFKKPYAKTSLNMHFKKRDKDGRLYRKRTVNGKDYIYYADEGRFIGNMWDDIPSMWANTPIHNESTGYPTQKPLALYGRIIKASSNSGDVVLDPFCGCATTIIAAERLGRQWVGIDIWDNAGKVVEERLTKEWLEVEKPDENTETKDTKNNPMSLFSERCVVLQELPERTDNGETASPYQQVKVRVQEPTGSVWKRKDMYDYLLEQYGPKCQGCDRTFDNPRYLELDHNTPRSQGGLNHISNRLLLCTPCNRLKSNTLTLEGLRRENKKLGYMAPDAD